MQNKEKEQTPGRKAHMLCRTKGDTVHMLSGYLETNDGSRKYQSEVRVVLLSPFSGFV